MAKQKVYGLEWPSFTPLPTIEIQIIRNGGKWKERGVEIGTGDLFFHYRRLQKLLWPEDKIFHRWNELELACYLKHRIIGILGPASAGKTNSAATNVLADYYCFPECTTGLFCSTTRERLEDRVWGEVKRFHKLAKKRFPWLPGYLIEGRQRLVSDERTMDEGRDFRNGLIGFPIKTGPASGNGLAELIGIKNKRIRVVADELQFLPPVVLDAIGNLGKNKDLKILGMGNPRDTTDSLGKLCEPTTELGGWDGGIDQQPGTKTWPTRMGGICIQLVGSDSPNMDVPAGQTVPYPFLITREAMEQDAKVYGRDDWHYTMFNEGRMPRGQGTRRIITRQAAIQFGAMDKPIWRDNTHTFIACLDAAYRGTGGDRCVFGLMKFGHEATSPDMSQIAGSLVSQKPYDAGGKVILSLLDLQTIPIENSSLATNTPEDQIVKFVMKECERIGIPPENFYFDSGMRTSLVTAFSRIWSPQVNSVDCGGKPSEGMVSTNISVRACDYYSKKITELWYTVRLIIEAGQFRGMTDGALEEFCAREWKTVKGNKIEVETKMELKSKLGRSPDEADCVVIGCYGAKEKGFKIAGFDRRTKRDEQWKREAVQKAQDLWRSKDLLAA